VLAVVAVLTAGWPLVSMAVADHRPLAAGTTVTVGPSAAESGRVTVGPGWSVQSADSNPQQVYSFARGGLRLSVRYVSLAGIGKHARLLPGMRQLLRIGDPGVTAGRPRALTTADGSRGLMAMLSGPDRTGRAAVVVSPTRAFAIEMVLLGPPSTARAINAAGIPVIESLRLPAAAR
jgi:hypothetical protein